MKKILEALGLVADMIPGAFLIVTGVATMVAASTGVLWH